MSKVAILWWGSFPYGQVTIGDYMSVAALCAELERRGLDFDIVHREAQFPSAPTIVEFATRHREFDAMQAETYAAAVFVCGPLPTAWPEGRERLNAFSNARRIAVGATLTSSEAREHAETVFHELYCRDGFARKWMDLSLACSWPIQGAGTRTGVGICWRGHEAFYKQRCANEPVESIASTLLALEGCQTRSIWTDIVDPAADVRGRDAQFADVTAVLTTRLHGMLLSLRHRTPFVAIDQQIGGGKVTAMAQFLGWPLFGSVEELSMVKLQGWLEAAWDQGWSEQSEAIREAAIASSNDTLRTVADAIEKATKAAIKN